MMRLLLTICMLQAWVFCADAQTRLTSCLNQRDFRQHWQVESESKDYTLRFHGDTLEMIAPKGLTLWRKERMNGTVDIEYDAMIVVNDSTDRLSDLNCFWMATDPLYPDDIMRRAKERGGVIKNCYSLRQYYLGYGGNYNSTTRFRRYRGDEVQNGKVVSQDNSPAILREYTDAEHLLQPNHWYHIRIHNQGNKVQYEIDGRRIVDFRDPEPLAEGWFGFRTTLSHVKITNFHCDYGDPYEKGVPLQWIGAKPNGAKNVSFGVPFRQGEVTKASNLELLADGGALSADKWATAYWPDGSLKWVGLATTVPSGVQNLKVVCEKSGKAGKSSHPTINVQDAGHYILVSTGAMNAYIPKSGGVLIDSLIVGGRIVGERMCLVCTTAPSPSVNGNANNYLHQYASKVTDVRLENCGDIRACVRIEGTHSDVEGREWLPFVVRLYFFAGSDEMRVVHSFVFDGDENRDFISSLGIRMDVPMKGERYNRHVAFSADGSVWSEPVQPLVGRRFLNTVRPASTQTSNQPFNPSFQNYERMQLQGQTIPPYAEFDSLSRTLLDSWATWDCYRISQTNPDGFSIRKRANDHRPWIGTEGGNRADGCAFVGTTEYGLAMWMKDFWQSYPSGIEISGTTTDKAQLTAWLWNPDAEPMDLRHYDDVAHGLDASYEDVQEGLSTPFGIARTTELLFKTTDGYRGKTEFSLLAREMAQTGVLMPIPQYLHDVQAFGIWSMPDTTTILARRVENKITAFADYYKKAIDQHRWYGFWNYGDVMHDYDAERHSWKYDVGGYAWDNTELASNMMLWYNFLRTADPELWTLAEAMTRHTSEVDVYHRGDYAGLGTRHNVCHWGCGAKEARISQALWNRFYYYLTTDERTGELMEEVKDADQLLYTLDPMRLAQPRSLYPCTAPARLRIGPDWLAYVGNWMTEWERKRDTRYRDKILAGMNSIAALPHGIFSGPKALGYDPATGVITSECDTSMQNTNHLLTIMGGFEMMNELIPMLNHQEWNRVWLDHATHYRRKALEISGNRFRVARLSAYSAYLNHDHDKAMEAWNELVGGRRGRNELDVVRLQTDVPETLHPIDEIQGLSTNYAATWTLDAIYMLEVLPTE
ncbi:MAG: hypothetical protein IKH26_07350 [Bacteroidaceae bacterium]|nr:hypothetical protein [Bacteroidaceae bacterium]